MYDINSERVKKRLEQMKKIKVKLEDGDNSHKVHNVTTDNEHDSYSPSLNTFSLLNDYTRKVYMDDNSNQSESSYSKTQSVDEITEVVVSDLECDFDEDCQNNTTSTKSFIPISNTLISKADAADRATLSYLMALGQYDKPEEKSKMKTYDVNDVIEEETSENNTDSEIIGNRMSNRLYSLKLSSDTLSEISSNSHAMQVNPVNRHCISETFNNVQVKSKKKYHKSSKSELINYKIDMNKVLENIQEKIDRESKDRLDIIKMRKEMLINNFYKSNSSHNLPYKINTETQINKARDKKLSCNLSSDYEKFLRLFNPNAFGSQSEFLSIKEEEENSHDDKRNQAEDLNNNSVIELSCNDINFESEEKDEEKEVNCSNIEDECKIEKKEEVDKEINYSIIEDHPQFDASYSEPEDNFVKHEEEEKEINFNFCEYTLGDIGSNTVQPKQEGFFSNYTNDLFTRLRKSSFSFQTPKYKTRQYSMDIQKPVIKIEEK
jgi:hypothetical protein